MIGIVVAGHGDWPQAMVSSAQMLMGQIENISHVGIYSSDSGTMIGQKLEQAKEEMLRNCTEIIMLFDIFGGSPSNAAVRFIEQQNIKAVTGTNMGMLLETIVMRDTMDTNELANYIIEKGKDAIKDLFQEVIDSSEVV